MEGQKGRLVPVKHAANLPYTRKTVYKMHSLGRYPDVIFKVGSTLFWDESAWERRVQEAREKRMRQVSKLRGVDR